jgi:agmatinase
VPPPKFLDLPDKHSRFADAAVLIQPIPFEATVTYGQGTAAGPAAIIAASTQVELYDREFDCEPALDYGIHTLPMLEPPPEPEAAVEEIAASVARSAATGKLVVALGGEHTISAGCGRGLLHARGGPLTVVQMDAHCDLRDSYEGLRYSHACVTRRLLEENGIEQVLQLGIRSLCGEEIAFVRAHPDRVRLWFAEDVHGDDWRDELVARVQGRRVYLTIDVDGLDPGLVPATGTPEPDGLSWTEALAILRTVARAAAIVGIDCVELAPHPGLNSSDYTVAKLLYKTISYAMGQPATGKVS